MENSKSLTIAIVCDPISDFTAGVVVSTLRFARGLKERGHNVVFIGARSPDNLRDNVYEGMKVYRFRSFLVPKSDGKLYLSVPTNGEIQRVLQDEHVDIVHIMLPMPSAIASIKAANRLHIPIVAHSHAQPENVLLQVPWFPGKGLVARLYYRYMAWIYNNAAAVIAVSPLGRELLISAGVKAAKITIISNGVDRTTFRRIDRRPYREKYGLLETAPVLVFVGRLQPEKCVDTLVRATPALLRKFPTLRVLIVGSGNLQSGLERLAASLGVGQAVRFAGFVPERDLAGSYAAGDIFVLPSLAELEGMVVLEAMACGKPLLIADAPASAARFFVKENGRLFKPRDPQDLAAQAIAILENPSLRDTMGDNSLQDSAQYEFHRSVEKLERLYGSVLGPIHA